MGVLHGEASQQVPYLLPPDCRGRDQSTARPQDEDEHEGEAGSGQGWEATPWMGRSKTLGSDMGHGFGQPRVLARTSSCTSTHVACKRITRKTPAEEIASAALRGGMMALHPEKVENTETEENPAKSSLPGGKQGRRIVIDLKRSGGNKKSYLPERVVLPRPYMT